jgi:hypothetical protein
MQPLLQEISNSIKGFVTGTISAIGLVTVSVVADLNEYAKLTLTTVSIIAGVYACIYYHKKIKKLN